MLRTVRGRCLAGLVTGAACLLALAAVVHWGAGGETFVSDVSGPATPWTHLDFRPGVSANFRFAIVSDRTGGHRPGVFALAVERLNLLQPEFVMSVGDFIEGHATDEGLLREQWAEFDGLVKRLEMPFFYVAGNHDVEGPVMSAVWKRRLGPRNYFFRYRDVLFLCLNSQDGGGESDSGRAGISDDQVAWAEGALGEHADVDWTFVFMHQPLWAFEENTARDGFEKLEALLQGRRYTVFAGHEHVYAVDIRNGRRHFTLSTTGGYSDLRGAEFGEFDHILWVTVTPSGPRIANLMLDGIRGGGLETGGAPEPGP